MALRLIQIVQLEDAAKTGRIVKVRKDSETGEFVCQLHVNGAHYEPADYFTSWKDDAIGTAQIMCKDPANKTIAQKIFDKYPTKGYAFAASVIYDSVKQDQCGSIKHWVFEDGSMIYFNTENKSWTI